MNSYSDGNVHVHLGAPLVRLWCDACAAETIHGNFRSCIHCQRNRRPPARVVVKAAKKPDRSISRKAPRSRRLVGG